MSTAGDLDTAPPHCAAGEQFITRAHLHRSVHPEWLPLLPAWLVWGVVAGGVVSVLVAGVFLIGGRLFPGDPTPSGPRIDGSTRRRTEIRSYLREISEPFAEDHEVRGRTVEFYLPGRDVALTFDARAYFELERAGTYTVLCEYEMPGRALGRRLPFEVPEVDCESGFHGSDPVSNAFDHLGLSRDASPGEVKNAYRDRVKRVHPDHGGSQAEFKRLQEAYATAREHAAE